MATTNSDTAQTPRTATPYPFAVHALTETGEPSRGAFYLCEGADEARAEAARLRSLNPRGLGFAAVDRATGEVV